MARTAVIAGTATAVSGSVRNKQAAAAPPSAEDQAAAAQQAADAQAYQQQQAAAGPPAAPAAPAPSAGDDIITQLERLGALHSQGVLTDDEFGAAKAKLLG